MWSLPDVAGLFRHTYANHEVQIASIIAARATYQKPCTITALDRVSFVNGGGHATANGKRSRARKKVKRSKDQHALAVQMHDGFVNR